LYCTVGSVVFTGSAPEVVKKWNIRVLLASFAAHTADIQLLAR